MTLAIEGVGRRFGAVQALGGVSLAVADGALLTVLGPSGSGKSTLLRVVAGLDPADEGRVRIDGEDVTAVPPQRRPVGMVFQSYALFPHLDVERNIGFGLRARRVAAAERAARVGEVAAALGLQDLLRRRPAQLSGGERQRVALARGLVRRPRVLLLDEPLSSLDAQLRAELRGELRRVHDASGVTTVHVTHDQTEALALGDRVALLRDGRVEQEGTPDEVWERPATTWVARFLGTPPMNLVPADVLGRAADGVVTIGFRPEDAAAAPDPAGLARFVRAERTGADRLWHLEAGGAAVVVREPAEQAPPAPGAAVRLEVRRRTAFGADGRAR